MAGTFTFIVWWRWPHTMRPSALVFSREFLSRPRPAQAWQKTLLVQNVLGFRLVDVFLGDNDDTGIDELLDLFLLDELFDGFNALFAHLVGTLNDDRRQRAVLDEVLKIFVTVEADGNDLASLAGLSKRAANTDRGRLVGAEDALQIRVGGQNVGVWFRAVAIWD